MGLDNLSEYALKCPLIDLVHGDCCFTHILYICKAGIVVTHEYNIKINQWKIFLLIKGNYIFQELHGAYVAVTYTMCIPKKPDCIVLM